LTEFALVVPLFFLLFFGIVDCARLFNTQLMLQYALREAGCFAVTGNHLPNPSDPNQTLSRVNSIIEIANRAAGRQLNGINITSHLGGSGHAGGPSDTITISLVHDMPLLTPVVGRFFPNGVYRCSVITTFRNEPFPPDQTL